MGNQYYRGNNASLKRTSVQHAWTPEMIQEYIKCSKDPIHFIETHMKITNVDATGLVPFILYDYQRDMINGLVNFRNNAFCLARQSGKSITICGFILWYIIFQETRCAAIIANKEMTANEILGRIQLAFKNLPEYLRPGIVEDNKGSFQLENGSRVIASATSSDNIRGQSVSFLYIDEAAFVPKFDAFFSSVYPTISSGKTTKIAMTSTPFGLNHWWSIIENAKQGKNDYNWMEIPWYKVPGRDEAWRQQTLAGMNFNQEQFDQEFNIEFLGSSGTLIAGWKLKELRSLTPMHKVDGLSQYKQAIPGHRYALSADVSEGVGLDSQAFSVIDTTQMPYEQVCTYKNNKTSPIEYAEIIFNISKTYNDALTLVESNDMGDRVCHILHYELEHPNLVQTEQTQIRKSISYGMGGKKTDKGIRTTKSIKKIGCSVLKLLVEQNQLIINDYDTIFELSTFSRKNDTYQAEEGKNDDMVMGLVLFAWLSHQDWFKEDTDINTLGTLRTKSEKEMLDELTTFISADAFTLDEELKIDGLPSEMVTPHETFRFRDFHDDEY